MRIVFTLFIAAVVFLGLGGSVRAQSLGQVQYPSGLDGGGTLFPAANNVQSQLSRQMGPTDTFLYLTGSASGFPPSGAVSVGPQGSAGTEIIFYSGKGTNYLSGLV